MMKRLKRAKAAKHAGGGQVRGCGAIGLGGVSEVAPLEAIAGEYVMPDMVSFEAEMMRKVEGLISAGALDAGNGEALDARIDMELERVCARFERQHAENAVMLDRIEASLQARLREIEVRETDVSQRLTGAREEAEELRGRAGAGERRSHRSAASTGSSVRALDATLDTGVVSRAHGVSADVGLSSRSYSAGSEAGSAASPTVVRIAPRVEDEARQEMKEVSNG